MPLIEHGVRGAVALSLVVLVACRSGTHPKPAPAATTTSSTQGSVASVLVTPPPMTEPLASDRVTLHAYNVHLNAADEPGFQRFSIVVHSPSPTIDVRITGSLASPNGSLRVCPITELRADLPTSRCVAAASGAAVQVPHAPTFTGVAIVQEGGPGKSGVDLDDVAVTYLATDRSMTLGLPNISPPPGASVCKDNGCNPFFEVVPGHAGEFVATATWEGIASAGLDMEMGGIVEHAYSATGHPYAAVASQEGSSDAGPGRLRITGSLDAATEVALALRNHGARLLLSPVIDVTWP